MALLDLPAHVNYVLSATGAKSVSYIGHSQGTIQAFAGFSRNHELASKVNLFIALAPVAYVQHQESLVLELSFKFRADKIFQMFGIKQFMTTKTGITKLGGWICQYLATGCDDVIELIVGPGKHINASKIDVFVSGTPSGTSVKNMVHWGQGMRNEVFQMYDYGRKGNMEHYNQTTPPPYRLEDLTVPTVLVTGDLDYLADPKDVATLMSKLPKSVLKKQIRMPTYAHLDFTWAKDAYTELYPQLVDLLKDAAPRPSVSLVV
eukprot:SRR837773.14663.p1 GENE.SRR837773.14663~~SRR837773.14663.p1  ORF type:complete len:295 (+),score=93.29 SRR837773.14663:102-887(+)